MFSRFISYPVFRLALIWSVGILVSDKLIARQEWLCPLAGFFLLLLILSVKCYFIKKYHRRYWFGVVASAAVAVAGGIWTQLHKERVEYGWSEETCEYVAWIRDVPRMSGKTVRALVEVEGTKGDSIWKAVGRKAVLYWMPDTVQGTLQCGDRLQFRTRMVPTSLSVEAPGFDYGRYLSRQGVSATGVVFVGQWRKLAKGHSLSVRQYALLYREKVLSLYRSWGLEGDVLAVVSALTVGDKSELSDELRNSYSAAGASHVLALSGLHVGLFVWILLVLTRPLCWVRRGKELQKLLLVIVLWGFAFLAGLSASVVRAVTMFTLYVLMEVGMGGRLQSFCAWSLTVFLMLVYNPLYLFDVSFQLSFMAVFSILYFYPLLEQLWHPRYRVLTSLWQAVVVSISAQLGTLPLVLYYFGAFPTYFILTNLLVTPLATVVLGSSVFALCMMPFPWLNEMMVKLLVWASSFMTESMNTIQQFEGAQFTELFLSDWQSFLLGLLLLVGGGCLANHTVKQYAYGLICLNMFLLGMIVRCCCPEAEYLCFSRGQVSLCKNNQTDVRFFDSGNYRIRGRWVAVFSDSKRPVPSSSDSLSRSCRKMEYVYLCGRFRGTVAEVRNCFTVETILLDASLDKEIRYRLIKECRQLGQNFIDCSDSGYYAIAL